MTETKKTWLESITSTGINTFKESPKFVRGGLIVLIIFAGIIKFTGPEIVNTSKGMADAIFGRQTLEEKQEEYIRIIAYQDSIAKENRKKKTEKAFEGRFEIQQECIRLQKLIPNCITVSFWNIHNGGAELKVDNNWELDVNESSDPELEIDFNEDTFKPNEPIWDGLIYFGNKVKNEGMFYIPDVSKDPSFYKGKLKRHVTIRGLKSTKAMYLGNNGKNLFFVSFDFDKTDPKNEYPFLREELRNFRRFVKERIEL